MTMTSDGVAARSAPEAPSRTESAVGFAVLAAILGAWLWGTLFAYHTQAGYWTRLVQEAHWLDAASLTYENTWFAPECPSTGFGGECPVRLLGGLPLSAEVPFASREHYLEAFANHKLHLVEQNFEYNAQSLRPVRYEQIQEMRLKSARCQCTVEADIGSLQFVKDHGVYRDTRPHGLYRNGLGLRDFSSGLVGAVLGIAILLMGVGVAAAKNTGYPALVGSVMALGLLTHGHWHLIYYEVMRHSIPF